MNSNNFKPSLDKMTTRAVAFNQTAPTSTNLADLFSCSSKFVINNFSSCDNRKSSINKLIRFTDFGMKNRSCWRIEVRPCLKWLNEPANYKADMQEWEKPNFFGIFLFLETVSEMELASSISVSIIDKRDKPTSPVWHFRNHFRVDLTKGRVFGGLVWRRFISHAEILAKKYLIEDCLRIQMTLRFSTRFDGGLVISGQYGGKLCDFLLISSDGQRFPVNKLDLALQSQVFTEVFEKDLNALQHRTYVVADTDGETILAMLKFLDGITDWKLEITEKLLIAAKKYEMKCLLDDCIKVILGQITMENSARFLMLADRYSLSDMKAKVIEFISNDLEGFALTGAMNQIESGLIREILDAAYEWIWKGMEQ